MKNREKNRTEGITAATPTVFNKQKPEEVISGRFQNVEEGTQPLGPA
jgi:hypothetical protein